MPQRIVLFGNAGAGKSTLARVLVEREELAHLDLDPLAWLPESPPRRRPLEASLAEIQRFTSREPRWVIEGCYADLLAPLLPSADALRFLNPGVETCVAHCRSRPWEPHKYPSQAEQDANLDMLVAWVRGYETRGGPLSLRAHRALFDAFQGDKLELRDPREWLE
ncbi:MAG: shikimate kinase [Deltaproteobacteria bacterium]|nr:shikimate kinase [Deltaproteobacteria bacterium]